MTKEELKKEAEEYALKQWEGNIPWSVIQKSYYDGALPREKRIAELEKENAELKLKLEALEGQTPWKDIKDKSELIKENAELKKQVEQKQHLADVRVEQSLENYKRFLDEQKKGIDTEIALEDKIDQLTKAKELLKQFLKAKNSEDTYKAEWETEQFLKDSEGK